MRFLFSTQCILLSLSMFFIWFLFWLSHLPYCLYCFRKLFRYIETMLIVFIWACLFFFLLSNGHINVVAIEGEALPKFCLSWKYYTLELTQCLGPQLVPSMFEGITDPTRQTCCLYTKHFQCSRFAFRKACRETRVLNNLIAQRLRLICGSLTYHLPRLACFDDQSFMLVVVGLVLLFLFGVYLVFYVFERVHYLYLSL